MSDLSEQASPRRSAVRLALVAAAIGAALAGGLALRRWAFDATAEARFPGDLLNAYRWGGMANKRGYLDLYRSVEPGAVEGRSLYLDYPPLRLLIMARWVRWTRGAFPGARSWDRSYEFVAPLLRLNDVFEMLAAGAVFALVALWSARAELARRGARPPPGWISTPRSRLHGSVAALLLWLNPALIWDAHCWPQWDAWAVGIFAVALLLASLDRPWTTGAVLGFGALLKGQVVAILPFFLLWLLFERRPRDAGRLLLGCATLLLFAGSPWLLGDSSAASWTLQPLALAWLLRVLGAAALAFPWAAWRQHPRRRYAALLAAAALLLLPGGALGSAWTALFAALGLGYSWHTVRRGGARPAREAGVWIATAGALALAGTVPLFDADLSWVRMGWLYGAHHYPVLRKGATANLPALLDAWYPEWQGRLLPGVRLALVGLYAAGLTVCAFAAARAARRFDRAVLACFAAPWALFFAVLPQMHERYLVFAAALSAAPAAVSLGGLLIHATLSALALAMMMPLAWMPEFLRGETELRPLASWCVLAAGAAALLAALGGLRARELDRPPTESPPPLDVSG